MNPTTARPIHPAAAIFPDMTAPEYETLKTDIKAHGLIEPITLHNGEMLDGRHRELVCRELGIEPRYRELPKDIDPWDYAYSANFTRRHLTDDQRAMCSAEWAKANRKPTGGAAHKSGANSTPTGGGVVGKRSKSQENPAKAEATSSWKVSGKKYEKAAGLLKNHPELAKRVKAGDMTLSGARQEITKAEKSARFEAATAAVSMELPENLARVEQARMQEFLGLDNIRGMDAIITDPPYSKDAVPLYGTLARLAKRYMKPGGILAVMTGQSHLPEVLRLMCNHLPYRWTFAYLTGSKAGTMWNAKVNTRWKPVLVFGGKPDWPSDVINCGPAEDDKEFHEWGQNLGGMKQLVEGLTKPGDLIVDPFMGAGTTGVAAVSSV